MTPVAPVSQAAIDLGLGGLSAELEDEMKKRRKEQGLAGDGRPAVYGDQSSQMTPAAAELFGGMR